MDYTPVFFNPPPPEPLPRKAALQEGDRSRRPVYVYTDAIVLAVNVALATKRPLLVSGAPGSGKSSLAADIARHLDRAFDHEVINSRTQGRDLLWRYDAVERLHAATARTDGPPPDLNPREYVRPGVLWRAFEAGRAGQPTVVLLDEMDKADPDVPNALLDVLGSRTFRVLETDDLVEVDEAATPLIVVTTNDERELSRAFVRRCVALTLPPSGSRRLLEIAEAHGLAGGLDRPVAAELARIVVRLRGEARAQGLTPPSAAEYLDALRACLQLNITPGSEAWPSLERATLLKRLEPEGPEPEEDPDGEPERVPGDAALPVRGG